MGGILLSPFNIGHTNIFSAHKVTLDTCLEKHTYPLMKMCIKPGEHILY